jgi:Late competence development protein ComFB
MSIYKNVMELLVEEEVARQFKALSPRIASYVNLAEWSAYALNQLPPLYATSKNGLRHQIQRGRAKHSAEIKQAVMRALAAIRRDPIRSSVPLESPFARFREVLLRLRTLLRNDKLEWDAIPLAVERAISRQPLARQLDQLEYSPSAVPSYLPATASRDAQPAPPRAPSTQRPEAQAEIFGWDDPLYNPR